MTLALVASDHLCTPEYILDRVRAVGPIAVDPCTNEHATTRPTYAFGPDSDGLLVDWLMYVKRADPYGVLAFVNPPYGRGHLKPWARKIRDEAAKGTEIISLVPNDPTTEWWATLRDSCQARVDIDHRVAFVGGAHKSGSIKSVVFYHGTRRFLFAHHFETLGETHLYTARQRHG